VDAPRAAAVIDPPPALIDLDHVPPREPFLLVANHFQAPGMWVGLVALAITAAVARARDPGCRDLHWMALSEWRWFEVAGRWVPNPLSALLFPRACRVWGLISTPARPSDLAGRARALRQVLGYLGRRSRDGAGRCEPVALFPEGTATVALGEARPGTGAFLSHTSRLGIPLLPVGVYHEAGRLVIRCGAPFLLTAARGIARDDEDALARRQVMIAIARLLPPHLHGAYAPAVADASTAPDQ
jgi:hypothetical protein